MDRHLLDEYCNTRPMSAEAVAAALALSGARPDRPAWRAFTATVLRAAGLAALGAGILFFVAANWQAYGTMGRFALLQVALLGCVGVALWRPAPSPTGHAALVLATLVSGSLLALFGQSYQTGADLHELFFTWALLALPFAIAARTGALWAVWCGVVNVGLALLCGWLGPEHAIWRFVAGWGLGRPALLMLPCVANLVAAGIVVRLSGSHAAMAPLWLARLLAAAGVLYGTVAAVAVVFDRSDGSNADDTWVVLAFAAISVAIAVATWQRRRDIFPITLLAASWIAISTAWLACAFRNTDVGAYFLVAFWLIASSTSSSLLLMRWLRDWRLPAGPAPGASS